MMVLGDLHPSFDKAVRLKGYQLGSIKDGLDSIIIANAYLPSNAEKRANCISPKLLALKLDLNGLDYILGGDFNDDFDLPM